MSKDYKRRLLLYLAMVCITLAIILGSTGCSSDSNAGKIQPSPAIEDVTAMDGNFTVERVGDIGKTRIYILHDKENDRDYFYYINPWYDSLGITPRLKANEKVTIQEQPELSIESNEVYL